MQRQSDFRCLTPHPVSQDIRSALREEKGTCYRSIPLPYCHNISSGTGLPHRHRPVPCMAHLKSDRYLCRISFCFASITAASFLIVCSEYTTPVGLFGVLTITALVFAVIFDSNSSSFGWNVSVSGEISTSTPS